jgi:tight adherence protein B
MTNAIFIALLVAALAGAEAVYYFVRFLGHRQTDELRRRLRLVGQPTAGVQILRRRKVSQIPWLNDFLGGLSFVQKLESVIEQTDLDLTVAKLLGYSIGLGLGGLATGIVLDNPSLALLLAVACAFLPIITVLRSRSRRAVAISEQLPEALEMMARSIRAGHALPASFKLVAQECPAPVAVEFARAYEQQNLGLPFEQAVVAMTGRAPSNLDLKLFAVSVVIQKETGGNLVEVLENIAQTMRDRFKFYSKLRALTAEGRVSGAILGSLPFVVAGLVMLANPEYLLELSKGLGLAILLGGLLSWICGMLWIRKLMKVDY